MDQNRKTKLLIPENQKPKQNQQQKIPQIPIIKGLKKTVSTMHLDTVEQLSLRIFTLQYIHCWIKNLIPAVDPTHTTRNPKIPMMIMMIAQLMGLSNSLTTQNPETSADDTKLTYNPKLWKISSWYSWSWTIHSQPKILKDLWERKRWLHSLFASPSNLPCHPDVLQQMQYEHYDHPPITLHQLHTRVLPKYKPNEGTNNYTNKLKKKKI